MLIAGTFQGFAQRRLVVVDVELLPEVFFSLTFNLMFLVVLFPLESSAIYLSLN